MSIKRKQLLWGALSVILLVVLFVAVKWVYVGYVLLFTPYGNWELNHGFKTPKPQQYVTLFYDYGPTGDGESFEYAGYDNETFQKMKSQNIWQTVTGDDQVAYLQKQIETCRRFMIQPPHSTDPFQKRPVKVMKGTKYYLRVKPDGSFFLVLLRENTKQIDVIENAG